MKNIYVMTTLTLLAISGILMAIGIKPVKHLPTGKLNLDANGYVADAR